MIGDSLEQDVLAPRRAGSAVWFNWKGDPRSPAGAPSIRELSELTQPLAANPIHPRSIPSQKR